MLLVWFVSRISAKSVFQGLFIVSGWLASRYARRGRLTFSNESPGDQFKDVSPTRVRGCCFQICWKIQGQPRMLNGRMLHSLVFSCKIACVLLQKGVFFH